MKRFLALIFVLILAALISSISSEAFAADRKYSKDIAQSVKNYLVDDKWNFDFNDKEGVFKFDLDIDTKLRTISYTIIIDENYFTVYVDSPVDADAKDPKALAAMSEFITRANYGLVNGNFEMDHEDGEIRYKIFVDCFGRQPSKEVIQASIETPANMFRTYSPGILAVMLLDANPKNAVEQCEK